MNNYTHYAESIKISLQWRHNERGGVSNHRRRDCFPNHMFKRRSKKTPKLRVTGLCEGNPPVAGGFPHKGPVTRKMLPVDVIMWSKFHKRLETWFPNNAIDFRDERINHAFIFSAYIYSVWLNDPQYCSALHLYLFPWTTLYSEVFSLTQAAIVDSVGVRCDVNY